MLILSFTSVCCTFLCLLNLMLTEACVIAVFVESFAKPFMYVSAHLKMLSIAVLND